MSTLSVLDTIGRSVFALGFEASPIILTGSSQITQSIAGQMVPIVALTEGLNLVEGAISGSIGSLNDLFAHFVPVAGSTLVDNQIGAYPFANQSVAANAVIAQPLAVSLHMICPVKQAGGYYAKLATLAILQKSLSTHNATGGTYIVATPSYIYTGCIMTGMRDVTPGEGRQVQIRWQFDFVQPLTTQEQATTSYNTMMSKLDSGVATSGDLSGAAVTTGQQLSGGAVSATPSATGLAGASAPVSTAPSSTSMGASVVEV